MLASNERLIERLDELEDNYDANSRVRGISHRLHGLHSSNNFLAPDGNPNCKNGRVSGPSHIRFRRR